MNHSIKLHIFNLSCCRKNPKQIDKATKTKHLCNVDAVDFLDKLLVMDHEDRLMPQDAMKHPYLLKLEEMADPRTVEGTPEYEQFRSGR